MSEATAVVPTVTESTQEELAIQRYLLDLALQPLESFDGFTGGEQLFGSALRYQLNFVCYALAMAQYTRTPAFTGYLSEAQRNTIDKMCARRVWSYWAKENLVGYGRWNPDPIAHANVMYTGYFGVMIGLYESLNDDQRYCTPGALQLRYNGRHGYAYDFTTLSEAILHNMRAGEQTQYPCEPHFIYPMCNTFAMNTLVIHDRLHDTDLTGDVVDRVHDEYTRFRYLRSDGRFFAGKGPLGIRLPPMLGNDAVMAYWLHPLMPDQAQRSWRLVRDRFTQLSESGKRLDPIDPTSYARDDAVTRAFTMCAANEHGDDETADILARSLDDRHEIVRRNGARKYRGASVWANAAVALATFTRPNGLRDLVSGCVPDAWRIGPVLAEAAYPDVLVARAVTDGNTLDLVLHPGNGAVRSTLKLARLNPGHAYRVTDGGERAVTADDDGTTLIDIELTGRTEVRVSPLYLDDRRGG